MSEVKKVFSFVTGDRSIEKWILQSKSVSVEVISLGCIITSIKTLDRNGQMEDIVLGFDDLESYLSNPRYFGAVVGRVANRIAKGSFNIDGKEYKLATNNGPNALHGGLRGFDKAVWTCEAVANGVRFSHVSPDGDEGYPGNLEVSVTYTLDENTLCMQFHAQTDQTTPVNLTNHSYFNLAGQGTPDIYDHEVTISAETYLPVDDTMIPTGQTKLEMKCARIVHPGTGRVLEVSTTQPGVQFYTSNFLDGTLKGKGGASYPKHSAFCLETQNWPDAVNQPQFPSALLKPREEYTHTTRYTFSVA